MKRIAIAFLFLSAAGFLGNYAAHEIIYKLSHVRINRHDNPVQFLDADAMIDPIKLKKISKWPPYPKEAFIGETQEGDWVKGWYVKINGPNSILKPYIGYYGTNFLIDMKDMKK